MVANHSPIACIGLRAKTARAIVVAVAGSGDSPRAVTRAEMRLDTTGKRELYQPFHEVMHIPWDEAILAVRDAERAIETIATQRLESLVSELCNRGFEVGSVAIVGAPDRNLKAIGSPHIRAHAAEGVLFRHVWQVAAQAIGTHAEAFPEKDIETLAANRLRLSAQALRARLAEFGEKLGRPWRADEKAAAMVAWVALSERNPV
jgi:hypothetical protein